MQGDPVLSADNDGNFYLVLISGIFWPPYYGGVWVAKSTDGGASWPQTLFRRLDNDLTFDDKPWITVDRVNPGTANYIYVAWSHGLPQEIWFARSTDGGDTFQTDTLSSMARGAQFGTSFAIGPNGNLYVAWRAMVSTQTYIFFTKSTDAGVTFETERQIFLCRSSAFINRLQRVFVFPYLAVNPSSRTLYITWNDAFTSDSLDTTDVFFSRSLDEGQTWSQPINIFNNLPIPAKAPNDQFFPFVVVSPEGEQVSVMYYDRTDFPNNDSMHVKVSISMAFPLFNLCASQTIHLIRVFLPSTGVFSETTTGWQQILPSQEKSISSGPTVVTAILISSCRQPISPLLQLFPLPLPTVGRRSVSQS